MSDGSETFQAGPPADRRWQPPAVWMVVMDRSGLFGCYFDYELADQTARSIGGVVARVPIAADYREHSEETP